LHIPFFHHCTHQKPPWLNISESRGTFVEGRTLSLAQVFQGFRSGAVQTTLNNLRVEAHCAHLPDSFNISHLQMLFIASRYARPQATWSVKSRFRTNSNGDGYSSAGDRKRRDNFVHRPIVQARRGSRLCRRALGRNRYRQRDT
jgi:hypothetical protein